MFSLPRSKPARPPGRTRPGAVAWLAACSLSLGLAATAHAQDALLDQAARMLREKDAAGAYAQLAPHEMERAGEPQFDYLLGMSALDAGHVTRAIFALERVVAARPDDQPARAELARAFLAAGENESARAELQRVRAEPMPPEAAAAIDRVLGVLDQVEPSARPRVTGYLEIGGGTDSNVNSATNAGQFAIPAFGGLLFTVAPGSMPRRDNFVAAAAGALVQVPLQPGWNLLASVNGRSTLNHRTHEMNTQLVDATAGVSHAAGAHVQTVALQSNGAWVSSSVYRTANGASAQWQTQFDPASQGGIFGQWARQEYRGQAERNADRSVLGLAYARTFDASGSLAYASVYAAREHTRQAEFAQYGHRATALRLGGEQKLSTRSVGFLEWQHERRRYGAAEPLFGIQRRDRQNDLLAGVRFTPAEGWQVVPQVRRTRAASNIVPYDYSRTIVQISLRKDFE